ncbi:MAG: glycosyltransferase family 39 protein [Halobacteriales archaeon]
MQRRTFSLATATIALGVAVTVWLIATEVFPYHSLNHDEAVYLQQAAMLLEGQLNLWPPVEDVFRPWFFIEDGDRLYPKYTPVPAVMFALGQLAGGFRLALAGIAAANLVLVVFLVRELFDEETGLLAGVLLLASPLFLIDSAVFLPYAPTTVLNLTFANAYVRGHRTDDRRWAAVAGGAIGLAFFARPFTAVLFALPFVVHALWTIMKDPPRALPRQTTTALLGLGGVALALGYNAVMTGSPWLFPYQEFAPLDGLGFGEREILGHDIRYTPELALRANREVLGLFFTKWITGGTIGAALAAIGVTYTARERFSSTQAVLAGLFVTFSVGNVYFWGNFNILGDLERTGDGLVGAFGPYYHFDLLIPTAAFGAVGLLWGVRSIYRLLDGTVDRRGAQAAVALIVVMSAIALGVPTTTTYETVIDRNMEATNTYETVYAPFDGGPPKDSLILLPDPYGDWLNHPFQPLRNDPGFDGRAVYAINDRPFEVIDAFPDRSVYRFAYRGVWAPYDGSPDAARLQAVRDVSGDRIRFRTTLGIPKGAIGVTTRIETEESSAYYVAPNASGMDSMTLELTLRPDQLRLTGNVRPVTEEPVTIDDRDTVELTVFVDYGAGGGFSYRFEFPVMSDGTEVRTLTPRIERCRNVRACGGSAAHVPAMAPTDVFVRTELVAIDPNP